MKINFEFGPKEKKFCEWVEFVILFSSLIIFYCSGLKSNIFYPDESAWIATSYVYEDYFSGNFFSSSWKESYWTVTQPPLPRYLIGLGRSIGGVGISDLNKAWDFQKNELANISEGRKPSEKALWWSRLPMGILAALATFTGYYFLKKVYGRLPAYIWVFLCILSLYIPKMLDRAMGESPLLACITGIMFISYQLLQRSDNKGLKKPGILYVYFILLGIAIGFAESSKLNGLSAIGAGFAIALLIAFKMKQERRIKIRFGLISFLILIFSSQLTFLMLNPYLWANPLIRTKTMFHNRLSEMSVQQIIYPDAKIQGFNDHIIVVTNRILQSYSTIHFDGALWINLFFLLIGLTSLIINAVQYLKRLNRNSAAVVILLVGAATSLPPIFTPLDWDRYYLIPVFFSTLGIAVGIWRSGLYCGTTLIGKYVNYQRKI